MTAGVSPDPADTFPKDLEALVDYIRADGAEVRRQETHDGAQSADAGLRAELSASQLTSAADGPARSS